MPLLCLSGNRTLCCGLFKKKRRILKFQSKKPPTKLGDFGIVNIVQEATPILPDDQPIISSIENEEQTATQQLAEQTSQMFEDIPPTRVGDRLIKSKIIPDQARALANALKYAVINPLKKTMTKKKSLDSTLNDQPLTNSHQVIVQSFSNPSSIFIENSDQQLNEPSIDSYESTSLNAITPPPAKPPRQNDESGSSSSIEIHSPLPPAKPPRHFSLYKNHHDMNILRQLNAHQLITSDIETFTVPPIRIAVKTDVPLKTESFSIRAFSSSSSIKPSSIVDKSTNQNIPSEIIQYATDLTKNILENIKKSRDNSSSYSPSIITTHISPIHSTKRPLIFVSNSNRTQTISPLRDIITIKPTPIFTTSVTVTSPPPPPLISSIKTMTNSNEDLNSTSTLIPDSNQTSNLLQMSSKRSSIESTDTITTNDDNTIFFPQTMGNITPTRSFLSDYDNLHGSYGSLNDDNQQTQTVTPILSTTSSSSSMSTIYESLDNFLSSSSTATTPTYVSAVSTFNTDGTRTPSQRINSDISDEDLVESFDYDRSSQVSTPIIEIIEDDSEPIDEDDMTFLTEVLAQYNHNLHHQDNLESINIPSSTDKEATLAGKGEETPSSSSSSSSSLSGPSSLLISTTPFSSTFPFFPTSHITIKTSSSKMPSKNSNIVYQQMNQFPSTITEENSLDQENKDHEKSHQRRLPLPTKLSFEQNLTNMIEKESPLLQSELLTAEHELSVLRSRLAVNEGVTAVTGTILESLKEQFQTQHTVDKTTSTLDMYKTNLHQQSSSIQTSPSLDTLSESVEIHYDAESPKSPYLVIKANNSFWLAQPIKNSDVENHLKKFSSPTMKRATIKLPEKFPLDMDFEDIDKESISEEDENSIIDRNEQLSEMKTIRSSSLFQQIDQFEKFDDKIDEIYSSIDHIKHNKFTQIIRNNLQKQIHQLKSILHNIQLTKQDELRLEYEFDELDNLFKYENNHFIQLFEQNLTELQHLIEQIRSKDSSSHHDLITEFETKLESIQNKSKIRLIPEDPVITSAMFFEGDKKSKGKKISPANIVRLIPEDPQINAASFYEGDIHRSFYAHPPPEQEKKILIPEKPLVSSEVFYEGDPRRSMFTERSVISPPISINNLREIMSDLMLAASWSKKPARLDQQQTKDEIEIHAESFITTEQHSKTPVCEIIHDIENYSVIPPSILIESTNEDMIIIENSPDKDITFIVVSPSSCENLLNDNIILEEEDLYYQTAVEIVNNVLENIQMNYDSELHSIKSSSSSIDEENHSEKFSLSDDDDDDEENEKLIPQISDQPYLSVTDVVTSKSTQELGNLVQELQTLEYQIHSIHPLSSSSSSSSSNLSIPQIVTTKSVNELTNLVFELQNIEEKLENQLDSPPQENLSSPISSKSFNELGGLMNELKTVTNRIHEEIFTSKNIRSLSQDIVKYRRDSQPIITNHHLHREEEENENEMIKHMIDQIIKEAQDILLKESSTNHSKITTKMIPSIVVDQRHRALHQLSTASISDDLDLSREDSIGDRTFELAAQLDYLRRMSRYENLLDEYEPIQQSTDSLDYHSTEDNEQKNSKVDSLHQHFQSAYDLHDEEKSKLVRSPELYNMDNVTKNDQRSSVTNSQIQYRTLSESALATDESKRQSLTITASNDASVEFLTTISKENSLESMQQQRHSTPFDDVLEKESSPEQSESSNLPISAFSDTFEPTSSCQRPLAFSTITQRRSITDLDYETVANDLVNQVLHDVLIELNDEQEENSSLSNQITSSSSSSTSTDDEILEENEDELLINNQQETSAKTSTHSSFSKILRRAQTDTKDVDIVPSPIALKPPLIRRSSQSDTETYFRAVSPSINDYIPMNNSSSDDENNCYLSVKYSGEGEESSGGKQRIIQRRKRSNDLSNSYDSPSVKNVSFKFETNENLNRQESLDSPSKDSTNEKLILRILQENILRTNLETFQIDLKFHNQGKEHFHPNTYSSTTKISLSYDDYDGGSETDRDDLKIQNKFFISSIDINIKNLLDDLIETIHDDLSTSSHSDATTVIFNSNKTSLDVEENRQINKHYLSSSSSSSSSSSHSVIHKHEQFPSHPKKQSSIPSLSNTQLIEHNTKKKFRSYPGSLVPFTSSTTSTTSSSGN